MKPMFRVRRSIAAVVALLTMPAIAEASCPTRKRRWSMDGVFGELRRPGRLLSDLRLHCRHYHERCMHAGFRRIISGSIWKRKACE